MRRVLITAVVGFTCGLAGLCAGLCLGPQLKASPSGRILSSLSEKMPWARLTTQTDKDSSFEMYDYPTIKWRPKPIADKPGGIAQLWTTYEWQDEKHQSGRMNYRLTVFKAPDKSQFEVQLLDNNGFKITQFDVSDFHQIPGSSELMEARDSHSCTEDQYKRVGDYSIK